MKITGPVAAIVIAAIVTVNALIAVLAIYADFDSAAIVGMGTGLTAILVNLAVLLRGQQAQARVNAEQNEQLDTIKEQTNGMAVADRKALAKQASVETVAALKNEGAI